MNLTGEEYATIENIGQKSEAWLAEAESYCGAKKRFQFSPDNSALLVIDCQKFFFEKDSHAFVPTSQAILPNLRSLVSAYRERKLPVIFTRHGMEGDQETGIMGVWWGDIIKLSDPMSRIIPELEPRDTEHTVTKTRYSAFKDTQLLKMLGDNGIGKLVVCGVLTHLCVESTARDGFMNDFEIYVPVDATATDSEVLHMSALRTLADGFAIPLSTPELLLSMEDYIL